MGKVLVVKILMNPQKLGLPVKFTERILLNFKIMTSVLYYCLLEYLMTMTEKLKFSQDRPGNDGISAFMIPQKELRLIYAKTHMPFRSEVF